MNEGDDDLAMGEICIDSLEVAEKYQMAKNIHN